MTDITKSYPSSVAVIMDGNGRWAKERGLPRTMGHKAGFDTFVKTVEACDELGVRFLTVYAFSTENWNRSAEEVSGIIKIMNTAIPVYVPKLMKRNARLRIYGDIGRFDQKTQDMLSESVKTLDGNSGITIGICLSYGGRAEITNAVNKLLAEGRTCVTEDDIASQLYTAGMPDPDLIIRTSGEKRISNFLLWQSAYSEYYFSDLYWPDFDRNELIKAFDDYAGRSRRYGK